MTDRPVRCTDSYTNKLNLAAKLIYIHIDMTSLETSPQRGRHTDRRVWSRAPKRLRHEVGPWSTLAKTPNSPARVYLFFSFIFLHATHKANHFSIPILPTLQRIMSLLNHKLKLSAARHRSGRSTMGGPF